MPNRMAVAREYFKMDYGVAVLRYLGFNRNYRGTRGRYYWVLNAVDMESRRLVELTINYTLWRKFKECMFAIAYGHGYDSTADGVFIIRCTVRHARGTAGRPQPYPEYHVSFKVLDNALTEIAAPAT